MLRRQPISTRTDPCFPYAALFRSDAVVPRVVHPDADRVALFHEGRFRVALQDRFDRAHFGKAAIADSALGDRLAGAAAGVAIRHRARPDDRSRAQIARLRRMGDELAEVEGHVDARNGPAARLAVEIDAKRPLPLTVPPAIAAHLGGDEP